MTTFSRLALTTLATSLVIAATACTKPAPPQLTPQSAQITQVDLAGFDMRVKMDAFNPNAVELSIRSVVAHVIVDGNQDLGTVTSSQPFTLPANAHTNIDVPLTVKWKGLGAVAQLAGAKRPVPYTVDGTATVGGEHLNVDVPFKLQGTMTAAQLQEATVKSLQGIPGLQGLPGLLPPK